MLAAHRHWQKIACKHVHCCIVETTSKEPPTTTGPAGSPATAGHICTAVVLLAVSYIHKKGANQSRSEQECVTRAETQQVGRILLCNTAVCCVTAVLIINYKGNDVYSFYHIYEYDKRSVAGGETKPNKQQAVGEFITHKATSNELLLLYRQVQRDQRETSPARLPEHSQQRHAFPLILTLLLYPHLIQCSQQQYYTL